MGDLFNQFLGWADFAVLWGSNPQQYTPPITGTETGTIPTALIIGGIVTLLLIFVLLYFIFK